MTDSSDIASQVPAAERLLAVDLGLKMGLALYRDDGRLITYRSQNVGSPARLRRAIERILDERPQPSWIYAEGDRGLFDLWRRAAQRREIHVRHISPETWRQDLLLTRNRRSGSEAKASAQRVARAIIDWSHAPRPTSLRHDAAEAIVLGFWGVLDRGWIGELPTVVERSR